MDFVFVNVTTDVKKKKKLIGKILKEFNIKSDKEGNTVFYKELENLRFELVKYLKQCDDPLDETIRLMFSTISDTIKEFTHDRKTVKFLQNKELFGHFFTDDEYYGSVGDVTYFYCDMCGVDIKDILFCNILPKHLNLLDILFHILESLSNQNYSNFILLSIKTKIMKLKHY